MVHGLSLGKHFWCWAGGKNSIHPSCWFIFVFGNPLCWEQKSGLVPLNLGATRVPGACAGVWITHVPKESERILAVQRSSACMCALGVCCCHCWLGYGEEENNTFPFQELLIRLVGEKGITLKVGEEPWVSKKQVTLADNFLNTFWNLCVVEWWWGWALLTAQAAFISCSNCILAL